MKRNPGTVCFEGIALEKWRYWPKGLQLINVPFSLAGLANASRWKDIQFMLWAEFSFPLGLVELLDQVTLQPCPLIFWHLRHIQVSGLWNIIWDKLLVFCHTAASFLNAGDYSIPYFPFRVCVMGLREWYCRQGVKCDSMTAAAAIPQYCASALYQNSLVSLVW